MEYDIPLPFSFLRKHFVPETGKVLGDITARTEDVLESLLHSKLQKKNSVQEDPFDESDFADESPVKGLLGYTVGQNGMMKNKRQKLLYNFVKYTNIPLVAIGIWSGVSQIHLSANKRPLNFLKLWPAMEKGRKDLPRWPSITGVKILRSFHG